MMMAARYWTRKLAFCGLALLAGCGGSSTQPGGAAKSAQPAPPPPPEVGVIEVTRGSVATTSELPGRMRAVRSAQVRARVEGILERRVYREGSEVKAGDLLFRIDDRVLKANVAAARAALAKSQADALVARQTLERMQALVADNAVSKQEVDQAAAREKLTAADVEAARATLARSEIDLAYAMVTAPIAGRIGRAMVTEGALVGRGEATHLATIDQLDPIWVDFNQSSRDFQRLRQALASGKAKAPADASVRLVMESGEVYPLPGKVLFSDPTVDPTTGSVGLRAEFPNPQRQLLPGQFATVRLPLAQADNVVVVPQRAVQSSSQGQFVLVVGADGKVVSQPVKTGVLSGANWIIASGLAGGERVIVDGIQQARPGSPVKPVPVAPLPGAGAPSSTAPPASSSKPTDTSGTNREGR